MRQYLDLLRKVMDEGTMQKNRTGIDAKRIEGAMLQFDMNDGFPLVTTKKMPFKTILAELIAFIRGVGNTADFRKLGCKIWDQNANENKQWLENPNRKGDDDLGRIYGVQWRGWYDKNGEVDQLANAIYDIMFNPTSRRIIVTAWNPGELNQMALPPCHLLFQFLVDNDELSICMYQRSCDMFLGVPFNIASYAALLSIVAKLTFKKPKKLIMFLADVHIYENHFDQVNLQLTREPFKLPTIRFNHGFCNGKTPIHILQNAVPLDIELLDYLSHDAIKGEMAV